MHAAWGGRRRARDASRRAPVPALLPLLAAALVVTAVAATALTPPAALAQTPYDEDVPPPSAPIVPTPTPSPTPAPAPAPPPPPAPTVAVPLPPPGPAGSAAATIGGESVTVVIRDPAARISADDPVLAIVPSVAVVGDGDRLLLPVGPAGSSREVRVTDLRVLEVAGIVALVATEGADGQVRSQDATGSLRADRGESFVLVIGGLLPGSSARLTIFSEPFDLGLFPVGADGTLAASAPVPDGLTDGGYTLQLDAVRADGQAVTVGQSIEVAAPTPPAPTEPTPAPAPAPAPTPPPTAAPAPEPVDAAASRAPSLVLALALLVGVLAARWYLARRRDDRDDHDDHDDIEHDAPAPSTPVGTSRTTLAGEPVRLVLLALPAAAVMAAWTLVGGAVLTRPRIESLVALVLLQWVGLRVIAGPARGVRADGSRLADVLGAAAGLTLGTGLHLALDAFFDAVPLLSGVAGPHLTIPMTLAVLAAAVATMSALIALRSRGDAPDLLAARPSTGDASRDDA